MLPCPFSGSAAPDAQGLRANPSPAQSNGPTASSGGTTGWNIRDQLTGRNRKNCWRVFGNCRRAQNINCACCLELREAAPQRPRLRFICRDKTPAFPRPANKMRTECLTQVAAPQRPQPTNQVALLGNDFSLPKQTPKQEAHHYD